MTIHRNRLSRRGHLEHAEELVDRLRGIARPLTDQADLDPLMERIGAARYVLLGEASHGTAEYYTWRARLSERLIREQGFSFVAVEGDWPECYRVDRYVKGGRDAGANALEVLNAFNRWPTWMWANQEVVEFVESIRRHNDEVPADRKVGFYGLDVYSLYDSMHAVVAYLERIDPLAAHRARHAYACFEPYGEDVERYAWATRAVPASCEDEVVRTLAELRRKAAVYEEDRREAFFNAEQNALIARNAERYYRTMVRGGAESWNVRDRHMVETLERLMQFRGPAARAIVWAHNTHVGDARSTDMVHHGMVNIGQLVRERHAVEDVVLVGFGSHHGHVIAAREWEAPMERMPVPPGQAGSCEDILHRVSEADRLFVFTPADEVAALLRPRGHRAIGVVYDPAYERFGNYVPTVLPRRYDAFLFIDRTEAVHPLHIRPAEVEVPETFPYAV